MVKEVHPAATERVDESRKDLDMRPVGEILEAMNREDQTVSESVRAALPQIEAAIEKIVGNLERGGRLFYVGAGTSGRIGVLDASEWPQTFGVAAHLATGLIAGGHPSLTADVEGSEDDEEAGRLEVKARVASGDVVVGIAASGRTPYVLAAIRSAREIGAVTVGLSCNQETSLSEFAEYAIEVPVGPEVLAGSTRLKAGTAQKMVLNMISTATMMKLGKVYGNLMVNVQATNRKLRIRAIEIVKRAANIDEETASSLLDQAAGHAAAAILMAKYGVSYEKAAAALEKAGGHFRKAMEAVVKEP